MCKKILLLTTVCLAVVGCNDNNEEKPLEPAPSIVEIKIECENDLIIKGLSTVCESNAVYIDGSSVNVTNDTEWSSEKDSIIDISSLSDKNQIKLAGLSNGSDALNAKYGSLTTSKSLSVEPATLYSLYIEAEGGYIEPVQLKAYESFKLKAMVDTSIGEYNVSHLAAWDYNEAEPKFGEGSTKINEGIVTARALPLNSSVSTTVTASLEYEEEIFESDFYFDVLGWIEMCNHAVNDTVKGSNQGECLKVASSPSNTDQLLTSPPSIAVMDALGYIEAPLSAGRKTYRATLTEENIIYAAVQQKENGGIEHDWLQYQGWCQELADAKFAGVSSWTTITDWQSHSIIASQFAWPVLSDYWSESMPAGIGGSVYNIMDFQSGNIEQEYYDKALLASCTASVSELEKVGLEYLPYPKKI